jgi:hypothetical protein
MNFDEDIWLESSCSSTNFSRIIVGQDRKKIRFLIRTLSDLIRF